MKNRFFGFLLFSAVLALITACKTQGSIVEPDLSDKVPTMVSPFYTNDGGKDMSLAILAPRATGLVEDQGYIPVLVQGEFVSNFSGYSAISVLDRVRLDEQYTELLSGYYDDNSEAGLDLGHLPPTTHIMGGSITRTAAGYALQMQITKTADKITVASYSGNCTFAELDNLTGIRRASLELLQKMGVTPTERSRTELAGAATVNRVSAQTALAQGIIAQQRGTEVTALTYYYQAAVFDPTLLEAVNRESVMTANITSGNIGMNVRNDIQWRNDWVARLTETEQYFDNLFKNSSPPYGLFYLTALETGNIDYRTETVRLSFKMNLHAFSTWFDLIPTAALQAVRDGLKATKRTDAWGLSSWPRQAVTSLNPFQSRRKDFAIVFELVNDKSEVIGRQSINLRGTWNFNFNSNNSSSIEYEENNFQTITFTAVNANKITDNLAIRIASVNNTDPETLTRNGSMQITAMKSFTNYEGYEFQRGVITKYTGQQKKIVIPGTTIWGDPVKAIGARVFANSNLTSVVIPDSVISIGQEAFLGKWYWDREVYSTSSSGEPIYKTVKKPHSSGNDLTAVTLGNGVVSIGDKAFHGNRLTDITIPDSVASIGGNAFSVNDLTTVTLGNSVASIGNDAFSDNRLTSVTIPNSVTSIGDNAFSVNGLTTVTLGNSVVSIGDSAFSRNRLTSVTIPNSVTSIGNDAFSDNLFTSVTLPDSVTISIGKKAFKSFGVVSKVNIGANVTLLLSDDTSYFLTSFYEEYSNNGKKAGTYTLRVGKKILLFLIPVIGWIISGNTSDWALSKP